MPNRIQGYISIRKKVDTGDLLEWRSNTFLGKAIRFFTKKNVNHSSLCIRLPEYGNWKEPHRFILEALADGINFNLISEELKKYDGQVWWYKLKPRFDEKREAIASWALLQVNKKYDYKSLFKNMFRRVSVDADKYFCSEFVEKAYIESGIINASEAVRPGEFKRFDIHEDGVQIL